MTREETYLFLMDLLSECVPKGQIDRVGYFYTHDIVGHFRGEKFYFEDLKNRVALLGKNITNHHIEIIDFVMFDHFIMVVSRQSWRNVSDAKIIELAMSVVYRMRDNKICELWVISDTQIADFITMNQKFFEATAPLQIDEKDKERFMHHLEARFMAGDKKFPKLSQRERESLYYYLTGFSAKEIANALGLSIRTAESYLNNVKNKLGCTTKTALRRIVFS